MEMSTLLAQVIGIYMLLEGLVVLTRRKFVIHIVDDMSNNKALMFVTGAMVTILGLLIVLTHNVWEPTWRAIPTLIGWAMVIKGVMVLFLPRIMLAKAKKFAKNRNLAVFVSLIVLAVGGFLVYTGFGLGM